MRWLAATAFVCAAFAWVPPLIDRAGLAALGFAGLALAVGRVKTSARPAGFIPALQNMLAPVPSFPPVTVDLPPPANGSEPEDLYDLDRDELIARLEAYGYDGAGGSARRPAER